MMKCTCCGRYAASQTSDELFAEEALLLCYDQAEAIANAEGSASIEIAHLLLALTQAQIARQIFTEMHIDPDRLGSAAASHTTCNASFKFCGTPEFSAEFLQVLRRAERATLDAQSDTVTLRCLVEILLYQSSDLGGTAFLHNMYLQTIKLDVDQECDRQFFCKDHSDATRRNQASVPVPTDRIDPFQLRVDLPADDDALRVDRMKRAYRRQTDANHVMRTSGPSNETSAAIMDFDRRLHEIQEQLSTVATQIRVLALGSDRANQSNIGVANSADRTSRSRPSSEKASHRGLSSKDLERIERILSQLDNTYAKRSGATRSIRRSVGNYQRRSKARIRATRLNWRSKHNSSVARAERDRSGERQNTREDWNRSSPPLSLVPSSTSKDDHDWGDENDPNVKRFYLEIDDEIVRAPSIGQRTADRLAPHGILLVRDLLGADAVDLAERINARHISAQRIEDWQMQARLVCTVPWLRGTHAQLLVGAGYTKPGDISEAAGDALSADILKFASSRDGQRILRSGPPPELEKILKWAEFATQAELERAA